MLDTVDKAEPMDQPQDLKSPIFSMLTGADGRFSFKTTPSAFSLYAQCTGYVGWGNDSSTTTFLALKQGQKINDIIIAMDAPGSISGRVIDPETEKPVPGLSVTAMVWQVSDGSRALVFAGKGATTDKNGGYEIKGLRPGEYLMEISPAYGEKFLPGGTEDEFRSSAQLAYVRSYYPGVERREQAESVNLLPGAKLEQIDFKFAKRRAAAIRGCIHSDVDADQAGDVTLDLISMEVQGTTSSFRAVANKTLRTGDCFRLESLSPGRYWLSAATKSASPAEARRGFAFFDLDDQKVDNIDLNLMRGLQISGKLRFAESVAGHLPKDLPLKIDLTAQGRSGVAGADPEAEVVSPSNGSFVMKNVFPGSYRVSVRGLPRDLAAGEVLYNGAKAGRNGFTTNPGAPGQSLEVVIYPATASISVTVEGGAKSADSQLVLLPEVHDGLDLMWDPLVVKADSEGRGTFANLLAGKYRVFAFSPNAVWRTDPAFAQQLISGQDVDAPPDAVQSVDVKLTQLR